MCDRECICKKCRYGPCGICKYNKKVLNQCRIGGIKDCKKFKNKEQEEYILTPDENGTTNINGEWYRVDKK